MRALVVVCLAVLGSCAGYEWHWGRVSSLPYYRSAALEPEWLSSREARSPAMHRVAPFRMTDQDGATVTERALARHVTIVHFFFTKCGDICPTTRRNIARALDSLGADDRVQVLSYSVTPERDSVAALRTYASTHRITDPRWRLLTGAKGDVERLARQSYFVRLGDGTTYNVATIAHTESLVLIDGERRIRGIYAGSLVLEVNRLVEDVRALLGKPSSSLAFPPSVKG